MRSTGSYIRQPTMSSAKSGGIRGQIFAVHPLTGRAERGVGSTEGGGYLKASAVLSNQSALGSKSHFSPTYNAPKSEVFSIHPVHQINKTQQTSAVIKSSTFKYSSSSAYPSCLLSDPNLVGK
ncbi:hypothetical protein J6590_030418 [Homalodisca vitripennis]|nr:hypothetical protein J6590_030418 [Homalodisca vitripennis]